MRADAEVVLVMGIPGAGKSRVAADYTTRGYVRLNRDERGGSLRDLAAALDEQLASGAGRVVLDNTYLTRAARNDVIEVAARHGIPARCIWLDTPLAQAQVNLVERLLERFGALPTPGELRELARQEPGVLAPASQMRALRELEPPSTDEGFTGVEHVPFARAPSSGRAGVLVAARALAEPGWERSIGDSEAPHLVYDWNPDDDRAALDAAAARLAAEVSGPVQTRSVPAPGRPADLLVPAAAAGAAARVRARARHRPVPFGPRRLRAGPPDARDDARRPLRPGHRVTTILPCACPSPR